jgi:dolichol-phosphate mannosyltransferase
MDLSIVIPCFNEVDSMSRLQSELCPVVTRLTQTRSVEVVFVDDGSSDGTWQALLATFAGLDYAQPEFWFERHNVNRGVGAALRTGFAAARGDVVVTTDSDGTYKFAEIPALLSYLTPAVDMVTASPYHPQGGVQDVPLHRLVLSRGSSMIYRLLVDWQIHTYTALFRAYRRQLLDDVTFTSDGFLGGTELMVNAMLAGYHVAEYPSTLHSRVRGVSKAKLKRTVLAHLRFQRGILLRRLKLAPMKTLKPAVGSVR